MRLSVWLRKAPRFLPAESTTRQREEIAAGRRIEALKLVEKRRCELTDLS